MTTETTQVETESANDAVRDGVQHILNQARDIVRVLESEVDELNGLMIELILRIPPEDEAVAQADAVGSAANELFSALDKRLEGLRREIAAGGDDDGHEDDDDEPAFRFEA